MYNHPHILQNLYHRNDESTMAELVPDLRETWPMAGGVGS